MIRFSLLSIAVLASLASMQANASFTIKIPMDKIGINFDQAYQNIGVNPNDDNTSTDNPACLIKNDDFALFGGALLKISQEEVLKCVVDIAVPKIIYDPACNENAVSETIRLWDMMRAKGVDGVSSTFFSGECVS